jgi:hypothetical protein
MATLDGAWFRWRHYHPNLAEDPRAAFAAGIQAGRRSMIEDSAQWVQLAPLLGSLLEELACLREERAIERDIIESDTREPAL